MASRICARRDLTAHASASSSELPSSPSSASSTASAKVTERGRALKGREGGPDVNQRSSRHSVKRSRVDSIPSSDGDEDDSADSAAPRAEQSDMTDVADEVKDSSALRHSAAAAHAPPPSTSDSTPSQPTTTVPASSRIDTAVPNEDDYTPRWMGKDKLEGMGLDPRVQRVLVVDLYSDSRFPSLPRVGRDYYTLPAHLKCSMTADLLGDPNGFAIIAPAIPRCLLQLTSPSFATPLSAQQQVWCEELTRQTQLYGKTVCDLTEKRRREGAVIGEAVSALFRHIDPKVLIPLWSNDLTSKWHDLLEPTSVILKDRVDTEQTKPGGHEHAGHIYSLRLCGATPEVTYIIACCLVSYATLSEDKPDVLSGVLRLLAGKPFTPVADSSTESDSSDSDAGFEQAGNRRQKARRGFKATCALKDALATVKASSLSDARGTADSSRPDLQLITCVTMRPWRDRFFSCIIDNWESLGLPDTWQLKADPLYRAVTTAIPELCDPARARWNLYEAAAGGTRVSLIVHEDLREVVATLNERLRAHPQLGNAALNVTCSMQRHSRRGRGPAVRGSDVKVCLTPEVIPVKRLPRVSPVSTLPGSQPLTTSPSPPGSFADRVKQSLRRVAQNPTRNNRPRKERKVTPSSAAPPASPNKPASSAAQSQAGKPTTSSPQAPSRSRSVPSSPLPNQSQPPTQPTSVPTGQPELIPPWQETLTKKLDTLQSNLDRQRTQFEVASAQWTTQRTQMMTDFQSLLQTSITNTVRTLLTEMLPSLLAPMLQQALGGLPAASMVPAVSAAMSAASQTQYNATPSVLSMQQQLPPMQQHHLPSMQGQLNLNQMQNLPSPSQTIGAMQSAYSPAMQNYYPNVLSGMFSPFSPYPQSYPPFYNPSATLSMVHGPLDGVGLGPHPASSGTSPLALVGGTFAAMQSPSAPAMGSADRGGAMLSSDTTDDAPVEST